MATIAPFLSDIGASEISPHVWSRTDTSSSSIRSLRERVGAEVSQAEASIKQLLTSRRTDFDLQEARTASLTSNLQDVQQEVNHCKQQLTREKEQLQLALAQQAAAQASALKSRTLAEAQERLWTVREQLQRVSASMEQGALADAVDHLPVGLDADATWLASTSQWKSLAEWRDDVATQVGSRLSDAACELVGVDVHQRSISISPQAQGKSSIPFYNQLLILETFG